MKSKQEIIIAGGIVQIKSSANISTIRIATDGSGGGTEYPEIVFYDRSLVEKFKVKDRVKIKAHMQTRKGRNDERTFYKDLVGDEISYIKRALDGYVDVPNYDPYDGGCAYDINQAIIIGKIRHVYQPENNNIVILSIIVPREDRANTFHNVEITCFQRQAEVAALLQDDDFVAVFAYVQTTNKKDAKGNTYQGLICRDIMKVDELETMK